MCRQIELFDRMMFRWFAYSYQNESVHSSSTICVCIKDILRLTKKLFERLIEISSAINKHRKRDTNKIHVQHKHERMYKHDGHKFYLGLLKRLHFCFKCAHSQYPNKFSTQKLCITHTLGI